MQDSNSEGVYTKTRAYNLLKKKIGVSKKVMIYHRLFESAFVEIEGGKYLMIPTEEQLDSIFEKIQIQKRNEECYEMKKAGKHDSVTEISKAIVHYFSLEVKLVA